MRGRTFPWIATSLCVLLVACSSPPDPETARGDARQDIEQAIVGWIDAFNRQDLDAVIDGHTTDIVSSFAGEDDLVGREQLRDLYSKMFAREGGSYSFDAQIEEVEAWDDVAYVRVIWMLTWDPDEGDAYVMRQERAMELWKLDTDGSWRLARWLGYQLEELPEMESEES